MRDIKPIFVKTRQGKYININLIKSYIHLLHWGDDNDNEVWWRELSILYLDGCHETVDILNEDYEKYFMRYSQ